MTKDEWKGKVNMKAYPNVLELTTFVQGTPIGDQTLHWWAALLTDAIIEVLAATREVVAEAKK